MPQGKGTYGSQVGRPSKKRTSYVNDNSWWDKLSSGFRNLKPYNPQSLVQDMKKREGKSMLTTKSRGDGMDAERSVEATRSTPPTREETSKAVRRLEDNPGLHQAYTGGRKNSRSKAGLWGIK